MFYRTFFKLDIFKEKSKSLSQKLVKLKILRALYTPADVPIFSRNYCLQVFNQHLSICRRFFDFNIFGVGAHIGTLLIDSKIGFLVALET